MAREAVSAAIAEDPRARNEVPLLEIEAHIREVAARYGVSPRLVAAIIEAESEFKPWAVSRKGARGLMQLMPATASSLDVEDSFDPFENIEGGVRHLRGLMNRFHGNLPLVLAAYNAGEQAVITYRGVPPYRETRRYVARILQRVGAEGVRTRRAEASVRAARSASDVRRPAVKPPSIQTTSEVLRPGAEPPSSRPTSPVAPPPVERRRNRTISEVLRAAPASEALAAPQARSSPRGGAARPPAESP